MAGVNVTESEALEALASCIGTTSQVAQDVVHALRARSHRTQEDLQRRIRDEQRRIEDLRTQAGDSREQQDGIEGERAHHEEALRRLAQLSAAVEIAARAFESEAGAIESMEGRAASAKAFLARRRADIEAYAAAQAGSGAAGLSEGSGASGGSGPAMHIPSTAGYRRSDRDPRDWRWADFYGPVPADLPLRTSIESVAGRASDQRDTPQCVCYSLAALKRCDELRMSDHSVDFDPGSIYSACKARDGSASDGTTARDAFKVAAKRGLVGTDGKRYYVKGYARLAGIDEIRHALSLGKPVMLGLRVSDDLSNVPRDGRVTVPANTDGGHCMLAVGYDDGTRSLRVRNSWGTEWGDTGHCWVPDEYLDSDSDFEAWTSVCDKMGTVEAAPTSASDARGRLGREVARSNFAWMRPSDIPVSQTERSGLHWKKISQETAARSLQRIGELRPLVPLDELKSGPHQTRDHLETLVDESGSRVVSEEDLRFFDLFFGSDAIRIDIDGRGGYSITNGRHRISMAQDLGIDAVPVSLGNAARAQLRDLIAKEGT